MVKSKDGGGGGNQSVAPFLKKCYEMVEDESTNSVISWSQGGDSFVIWDITQFSVQLLPKYFKHNNFSSFIRQLNIYGFRKIDTDRWEFSNDGFIREQRHLLKNISRRKNAQGTDNQKPSQQDAIVEPVEKVERLDLWKEVENLKVDKNVVMQELAKLRQYQESAENKMHLLRDRLQGMEKNQQQMLSFLVMVMQYPEFLVQLLHPKENNWRMAPQGTILEQGADDPGQRAPDGMIVRYNPPATEMPASINTETRQHSIPSTLGTSDLFMSPEFVKMFSNDNIFSLENLQNSLVAPELSDDGAWEQFILANPFSENVDTKKDGEEPTDAETNVPVEEPQNFNSLAEHMEILKKAEDDISTGDSAKDHTEQFQRLEYLTRQMDLLASESSHEDLQ